MAIDDTVHAGKAIALCEWLKRGVEMMPQPVDNMPRGQLLANLARVQQIPFGNQVLNIAANQHRPAERDAYIVEVRDRDYLSEFARRGVQEVWQYGIAFCRKKCLIEKG